MKYISFTFDDGRKDNYTYAYSVMNKYNITGSLYCTTGFIDGTWIKDSSWNSAELPLSIDEILCLKQAGWEIGLHGDKHTTSVEDLKIASQKLVHWGISTSSVGFSIPNSSTKEKELKDVIQQCMGKEINYIRTGRKINTKKFYAKMLFAMYTLFRSQIAYNWFNSINLNKINSIKRNCIYSIVVRFEDNPKMILNFIKKMPDNSWAVLMFHSILPKNHYLYNSDPWNWDVDKLEQFCRFINNEKIKHTLIIKNVEDVLNDISKK